MVVVVVGSVYCFSFHADVYYRSASGAEEEPVVRSKEPGGSRRRGRAIARTQSPEKRHDDISPIDSRMKLSTWLYIVLRLERESNEREMMMMMNGKAPASELRMISHSNRSPDEYRIDRHRWGNCLITTNCCCPFSPAIHSSFWAPIHNTVDPVIVLLTSMLTNSSPVH